MRGNSDLIDYNKHFFFQNITNLHAENNYNSSLHNFHQKGTNIVHQSKDDGDGHRKRAENIIENLEWPRITCLSSKIHDVARYLLNMNIICTHMTAEHTMVFCDNIFRFVSTPMSITAAAHRTSEIFSVCAIYTRYDKLFL